LILNFLANSNHLQEPNTEYQTSKELDDVTIEPPDMFKIGVFRLKDNESNNFTERELKSIDVDKE
jgi:hypothetical protein